ncbi:MAG: hypothetical protein K0R00_935 [Herbinix sp.]|jgi:hypothetical protein|nr:hypothetical protein [Herbinix sp.]
MRRYNPPYNGNRYVLNRNTNEIHDLDFETQSCQINEIKSDHVQNCSSYEDAALRGLLFNGKNPNGCYYCLPSKDNG